MNNNANVGQVQQPYADPGTVLTPDGQVAQRIVNQLVAEGLIDATQAESVWRGLASGAARSSDWRYIAETAVVMEV